MRIGLGYDAHAFSRGRKLYLGGVCIPDETGLSGHSDADVLLHAISDALLGAAGEMDIGSHFPDSDKSIEGIESGKILSRVAYLVRARAYTIVNVDAVVVCEVPKIQPYRERMKDAIARILEIPADRINIRGKTTEGMGFTGRREGIACYAVCLLE